MTLRRALTLIFLVTTVAPIRADRDDDARSFRECQECPEMVVIRAGRFTMGSPVGEVGRGADEGPQHSVSIAHDFALARHEVTRSEFELFVRETGQDPQGCRVYDGTGWTLDESRSWRDPGFPQTKRHPTVCVNFDDTQDYVEWLADKTGQPYRLPTEAEWEYAARGRTTAARYWGDDPADACTYANVADQTAKKRYPIMWTLHPCEDGFVHTAPVASFAPNEFGLQDMLGNVWEWVEDCWNPRYSGAPENGEAWILGDCARRVVRGGSYGLGPANVRSADRNWFDAPNRSSVLGFRVAKTLVGAPPTAPLAPSTRAPF